MNRRAIAGILATVLVLAYWMNSWRGHDPRLASGDTKTSSLYTGKEPKRKLRITFPATGKPGFVQESVEIFATRAESSQVKQVLLALYRGGKAPGAGKAFPGAWKTREVFLDGKGLVVVDLESSSLALPGGTTAEYMSLYTLVKTLRDAFPSIRAVQILVDGERRDSLAGHIDISDPLTLEDF